MVHTNQVAKNRNKRIEQKEDSLAEYRAKFPERVAQLTVVKGLRKPKRKDRAMPGAVFLVDGKEQVLRGSHGKIRKKGMPAYYEFDGLPDYITPRNCKLLHKGGGWQYIKLTH